MEAAEIGVAEGLGGESKVKRMIAMVVRRADLGPCGGQGSGKDETAEGRAGSRWLGAQRRCWHGEIGVRWCRAREWECVEWVAAEAGKGEGSGYPNGGGCQDGVCGFAEEDVCE
ncbi:unnamed protein product [Sphenostylis stenocarpa]|uniref:Uncharacterized protein n=1 Tax=Sphenostylis stenocarpa TaxID=92480 RepID=A0AA86S504_9FABA|nr:unnamed protein product [Sphenostylis stenocarpa]